jgi:Tol biopolymer transport system component
VTTSGVDLDPDGYVVAVDPTIRGVVGSSDQVRLEGVPAGQQSTRLSGLAANCSVQGENPVTVDVPPGGEADTTFVVRCWPPPSGRIAFVTSSSVEIVTPGGVTLNSFAFESPGLPSWSPDGQFIAFVGSSVLVQPLSGGTAVELPGCLPSGNRPVWSRDGSRLLCLSDEGRLSTVQRDGSNQRFVSPENGIRVISASFLPDGGIFLFAEVQGEGFEAFRAAVDGSDLTRLFTLSEDITFSEKTVIPSPDGQSVAYVLGFLPADLYVAGIDGTNAQVVASSTAGMSTQTAPVWAPDGSRIAFSVGEAAQLSELWMVDPDGTDLIQAPLPGDAIFPGVGVLDWSPDGTHLVFEFSSGPGEEPGVGVVPSSIFTIRADGSGLQRLTGSTDARMPAWGP